MGEVYRAVHRTLGRSRAIKVLPPDLARDQQFVARFRREATIASGLRHPNIVLIYDIADEAGLHYIVMDLLAGRSLRELNEAGGPLPWQRAMHLLRQLADALDYAHGQGVLHRDVKPANVVVGPDDRVTLVDFGIARAGVGMSLTAPHAIVGTPAYIAPEAWRGGEPGASADLYALGVVAYELLTGRMPFPSESITEVMYAHVHTPPPPPRSLRAGLPETVERVLLRQLAKLPEGRYPSAGSFVEALVGGGHDADPDAVTRGTSPSAGTPIEEPRLGSMGATPPPQAGWPQAEPPIRAIGPDGSRVHAATVPDAPGIPPPPLLGPPRGLSHWRWGLGIAAVALLVVGASTLLVISGGRRAAPAAGLNGAATAPPTEAAPPVAPPTPSMPSTATPAPAPPASSPSPTTAPPAAVLPIAAPSPDPAAVIMDDNFDDPALGQLPKVSTDPTKWEWGYEAGEFTIRELDPNDRGAISVSVPGRYANASIAVDVRLVGDIERRWAHVSCRAEGIGPNSQQYRFLVRPDLGLFQLSRLDGGIYVDLVTETSNLIRRGGQTNRLELSCVGSTISASINGTQITTVQDATYSQGRLGFGVGASGQGTAEGRFNNLLALRR